MTRTRAHGARKCGLWVGAACAILSLSAESGKPLQMQLHWAEIPGVRQIENGAYEHGVQRLEARRAKVTQPAMRAAILIDLCAGYAMLNRLEEAAEACDEAISTKHYTNLAYNNRGVLNMMQARYAEARDDFEAAGQLTVSSKVARTNLQQAEQRLAAIASQRQQAVFAGNIDAASTSTTTLHHAGR